MCYVVPTVISVVPEIGPWAGLLEVNSPHRLDRWVADRVTGGRLLEVDGRRTTPRWIAGQ
jgi:hypothetical protein